MARKRKEIKELQIERPEQAQLSAEESLKRMQDFAQRKERIVAAVRQVVQHESQARVIFTGPPD